MTYGGLHVRFAPVRAPVPSWQPEEPPSTPTVFPVAPGIWWRKGDGSGTAGLSLLMLQFIPLAGETPSQCVLTYKPPFFSFLLPGSHL